MTTTTAIARSGPAIRAALLQWSPGECEQFEAEFQGAAQAAVGRDRPRAACDAARVGSG